MVTRSGFVEMERGDETRDGMMEWACNFPPSFSFNSFTSHLFSFFSVHIFGLRKWAAYAF